MKTTQELNDDYTLANYGDEAFYKYLTKARLQEVEWDDFINSEVQD